MVAISIAEWSNYLTAQAEVAATLTGLIFVAVSINLGRILSIQGLTRRAAESIMHLSDVVIISTDSATPPAVVGAEILEVLAPFFGTSKRLFRFDT